MGVGVSQEGRRFKMVPRLSYRGYSNLQSPARTPGTLNVFGPTLQSGDNDQTEALQRKT